MSAIPAIETRVMVAGGGIGGLACALALGRRGVPVTVLEQAVHFNEVGAGVQLGPNAVRVLADWGLDNALRAVAAYPDELRVSDARDGRELGHLRLGETALARYGQPFACVHRADLHQLLLDAVRSQTSATLRLQARLQAFDVQVNGVRVSLDQNRTLSGAALIGCDGLWSRVREGLLGPTAVRLTGHLAYRGLIPADRLPRTSRRNAVQVWLGARMHIVTYPVRGGDWVNLVAVVHGRLPEDQVDGQGGDSPRRWNRDARVEDLLAATGPVADELRRSIDSVPTWTRWALHDRPALRDPSEHARGPVALLGDAAHPFRPYLAQGAGMAMEDAWTLGLLVDGHQAKLDWAVLFSQYAAQRWARNARVQRVSQRNGHIYHARGLLRMCRDLGLTLLGERLMANAWLYGGPPRPLTRP